MSSTILYKFRSGTTFEALSLPGNNARLLDIKKAIVTAKKLDQGSMDFDLSVKDATSGVEYIDDTAILPRGSRIVVQRLPSARGQGILAKIARSQFGEHAPIKNTSGNDVNTDFYTIENRDHDDDEEFVSSTASQPSSLPAEDSELAALRAATELTHSTGKGMGRGIGGTVLRGGPMPGSGGFRPNHVAGMGAPPSRGPDNLQNLKHGNRPNADPELREQEQQPQKKRATGIPRTFLSLSAAQGPDGAEGSSVVIQPNSFVFEELIIRGGGQSENATGSKRDLDYAIKITATKIPEYLLCAICNNVVRDAMMLPWDPEGRTTCEQCIRNALTENGFRCPLTQQEGVSPDDLLPNYALRKAAAQFINDVMEKLKEIDVQADMEEEINVESDKQNLLEGDLNDKGVVLTRRVTIAETRKKDDNDFGGGDDDFGGDVFAVEPEKLEEVVLDDPMNPEASTDETKQQSNLNESYGITTDDPTGRVNPPVDAPNMNISETNLDDVKKGESNPDDVKPIADTPLVESIRTDQLTTLDESKATTAGDSSAPITTNDSIVFQNRRLAPKRRGPPVGYSMGPAVAAVQDPINTSPNQSAYVERAPYRGRRGGPHYSSNGRGFRGRYDPNRAGGRDAGLQSSYGRSHGNEEQDTSESRVAKRTRSPSESADDDYSMGARLEEGDSSNNWSTSHDAGGRGEASRGNYHYDNGRGRWGGRGGRDDGYGNRSGRWEGQREGRFPRGAYRGGFFRGGRGRDGYQGGGYIGGSREGFGGGRGYRGGGRGRY